MNVPSVVQKDVKTEASNDIHPLSFEQRAVWFGSKLDQTRCAYNVPRALLITGDLDVTALARGLSELIQRHAVLRTIFRTVEGEPRQFVVPEWRVPLPITDLCKLKPTERMLRARRIVETEAESPFQYAETPLLRAQLLRTDEQQHLLFVGTHHMIFDERSEPILIHELLAAYRAFADGRAPELPELPIQYRDYVDRQRTLVKGQIFEKRLEYWRRQLSDLPSLELPIDRPRPKIQTFRGANVPIELPLKLTDTLKELGKTESATLFMILLGAFQVVLARLSGQEDIVIGSVLVNRHNDTKGLIGLFTNTVMCRTKLSGNPTFREVLRRVREMALAATSNQLPFESIVEALTPRRALNRIPLYQVSFLLSRDRPKSYSIGDLRLELMEIEEHTAKVDLSMRLFNGQDGVRGYLNYNTDLFDSATIRRMVIYFRTLLEGIAADCDARISELPMVGSVERNKVLREWNDTSRDYPKNVRLHELIEAQVERTPAAVAIIFEEERLSYREVNQRANRLAHRLRKLGVASESIVGVFAERSVEMIVGLVATLKAGGAYLPLDPSHPPDRLNFMLSEAQPFVLLAQRGLAAHLPQFPGKVVYLEDDFSGERDDNISNATKPENLAYVIYTSGSTGQPKGVMNTHRGICNWLLWLQETYPLNNADRILQKTAFTFDASLGEFFRSLTAGSQLVLARPGLHGDSRYLIKTICENHITAIQFVPSMLSAFLEDNNAGRCLSLRYVICGGEALPVELQERFFAVLPQAELHNVYGPTEAAVVVTHWKCELGSAEHIVPIGRPIANTQIYILDRVMQPVPLGVVGEIHIGGVQVASGYHSRPELTAERFVPNPFGEGRLYKTGDLARHRSDGAIEFLGRIDHQVKLRGFRIELGEIEGVLKEHPAVHGAVVTAHQNNSQISRLVAYVTGDLSRIKVRELQALLKAKLPEYMLPSAILSLEKFPLNLNGKIDRRALPAPSITRGEKAFVEASTTLEAQLVAIWESVLEMAPIGVTDDFFEIGGDSLLGTRIFSEIQNTTGRNLPLATLFQMPTIEKLAAALRQDGWKPNWAPLVAVQPQGSRPPFFSVHGGFGGVLFYGALARLLGTDQPFYSLQAEGLDGGPIKHPTIPSMATYYLHEISRVQPHGPYFLGGYSFGGVVAFEMAQQLHAIGEKVALLVLFDSLNAEKPRRRSIAARVRKRVQALRSSGEGEIVRNLLRGTCHKLTSVLAKRLQNAQKLLHRSELLAEGSISDPTSAVQLVQMSNKRALADYKLRSYAGRVTLFRAEDPDDGHVHAADYGWTKFAKGGISIHEIPGKHQVIFAPPNVSVLAEKLDACIRVILAEYVRRV